MGGCSDFQGVGSGYGKSYCVVVEVTTRDGSKGQDVQKGFLSGHDLDASVSLRTEEGWVTSFGDTIKRHILYELAEGQSDIVKTYFTTSDTNPNSFTSFNGVSVAITELKYHIRALCERKRIYRKPGIISGCRVEITHESVARIPNPIPGLDDIWRTLSTKKQTIYFPGEQIEKITYQDIDFTTEENLKLLGRRINLINQDGKHLLKGFFEGQKGKAIKLPGGLFPESSHFIGIPPFEIDKYTIFWANDAREVYVSPEDNEEKHVFIDGNSIVLDADQFGFYEFDKASVAEFKPAEYITFDTNLARELIEDKLYKHKFLSTGRTKTKREDRTFNSYTYKHKIETIPILSDADNREEIDSFILHTGTDDGVNWYKDEWEIVSGECDVNVFDPDPWKFPKINLPNPDLDFPEIPEIKLPEVKINFPRVPVVDIRDFTIDIGEFAPLFSGLHQKLDNIIQRLERVENEINSVQLPNITWEVPSVGFGDPNLGTENSYPASQKGLQQTFDQLGIILRGLGNTIAHNKSVIGEVGDVIGVPAWREGYREKVPAKLPISLRKIEDEEPEEIEIYTLTQLLQWYIINFDELIGQFDTSFEIADSDLAEEGEQPTVLTAQNIAEALTEIWGASTLSLINSELIVQIALKALVESGQAKKSAAVNHTYLQAIVAYLNFEQEDFTFEMPLTFTPGKEDMAEILKETDCESEGIRFKGKDTLQSSLQDLLQAAAITRAKNFIGLGKDLAQSEVTKKIVARIKEVAKNKQFLQNFNGSFDDFIKDVESGFTENRPGAQSVWQDGQEPEITELEIPKDNNK